MSYYDKYNKYTQSGDNENKTNQEGRVQFQDPVFSSSGGSGGKPPKKGKGNHVPVIVASVLAGGILLGSVVGWGVSNKTQKLEAARTATIAQASVSPTVTSSNQSTENIKENSTEGIANSSANESATDNGKSFNLEEFTAKLSADGRESKKASEIYKEVNPSIVAITSEFETQANFSSATQTTSGAGSGIIIADEGYVLTNNHVIDGATKVIVKTSDGEEHTAELVGQDSLTDLAVLKFDNTNKYPAAPLGDSDSLEVGEMVIAIGNPLGELSNSLSAGAISAINRTIDVDSGSMKFIQTTAPISPGNSGGALINSYGEVIGVTTAKSLGSGVEGIGYAIPINDAKRVIEELINNGYVTGRPYIGINGESVDADAAQWYNWPEGLYITSVGYNTPAEEAGLQVGDIITAVNGKAVTSVEDINTIKSELKPGDTMTIEISRKAEKQTVTLTLGEVRPLTEEEQQAALKRQQEEQQQRQQQQSKSYAQNGNGQSANGYSDSDLEQFFNQFFGQ